jgi:hypothetical protein
MTDPRVCEFFTLVFQGDIRKMPNPLTTKTPFGTPIIAGIGNAFEELDAANERLKVIEQ